MTDDSDNDDNLDDDDDDNLDDDDDDNLDDDGILLVFIFLGDYCKIGTDFMAVSITFSCTSDFVLCLQLLSSVDSLKSSPQNVIIKCYLLSSVASYKHVMKANALMER